MKRLFFLVLALLVALTLGAPAAFADEHEDAGRAGDNYAIAENEKDNSNVFDFAFNVRRVMHGDVTNTNAAIAYASCDSCRTVAIAIQVVLVASDPDVAAPENAAIAVNYECTSCETMALAYQYVLSTDGPVRLTAEASRQIRDLVKQIQEIGSSTELELAEIDAQVSALVEELFAVLDAGLVPVGNDEDEEGEEDQGEEEGDDQVEETPASDPTGEAEPTPTSSVVPSPTETSVESDVETSPEPTTEATPDATP
jgi:putative peptide zinc metalloprotease protein